MAHIKPVTLSECRTPRPAPALADPLPDVGNTEHKIKTSILGLEKQVYVRKETRRDLCLWAFLVELVRV